MASISKDKSGNRLIQFMDGEQRRSVWLGKMRQSTAETWKSHIEELISARNEGRSPYPATSSWVGQLGDKHHKKLSSVGLVPKRSASREVLLGEFLAGYIANRTDVKKGTAIVYGHTQRCLIGFFGDDKPLHEITPAEAMDWRRWLGSSNDHPEPLKQGQGLSDNTVRRRCGIARQFFADALSRRLITANPFAEMKGVVVRANRSRDYFVTQEEAAAILKACSDAQWRLIFALSRYGGLRCPSEHLALRWGDIDWTQGKITIRSSKTEHHEGQGVRVMPLFPELLPYLQAVRDELLEDFDPKQQRLSEQPVITRYRLKNINLRTQLCKIIRRAGLKPWPKLFQNLRATRATELADEYPDHVAASWLGHSSTIADKHYRQTTEDHFARALQGGSNLQNPMQSGVVANLQGDVREKVTPADTRVSKGLRFLTRLRVGDTGPENTSNSSEELSELAGLLADSYAISDVSTQGLGIVASTWPELPTVVQQAILATICTVVG